MNSLDLLLIVVLVMYAASGFVQGFLVNLAATLGLVAGGMLGVVTVPFLLPADGPTLSSSLLALALVVAAAGIGQVVGTSVGSAARVQPNARRQCVPALPRPVRGRVHSLDRAA
jgi:uncharacterized membrane protein required for colicin V production